MGSNHERGASVIYLLTTDLQTVNYYLIIYALCVTYFDSNTPEAMKKLYPSNSSNCPLFITRTNDVTPFNVKAT